MPPQVAPDSEVTSLHELSALLLRERDVLRLILDGVTRAEGEEERDALLRSVTSLELHRAIAARAVAVELGMDREPTLRELAARAPSTWTEALFSHLGALESLVAAIGEAVRPAPAPRVPGNIIPFPGPTPTLQRSLLEFLG